MNEKIEIEEVLKKYDELGFDANQDYPGNFLWEELYLASPKERARKSSEYTGGSHIGLYTFVLIESH